MSEERISKVVKELNIALGRAVDFLNSKGAKLRADPNAKITEEQINLLKKEFGADIKDKKEASSLSIGKKVETYASEQKAASTKKSEEDIFIKQSAVQQEFKSDTSIPKPQEPSLQSQGFVEMPKNKVEGLKVIGKIELPGTTKKAGLPTKPEVLEIPKTEVKPVIQEEKPFVKAEEKPIEIAKEEPKTVIEKSEELIVDTIVENSSNNEIETTIDETVFVQTELENEEELPTELIEAKAETLKGLTVLGKIELKPEKLPSKEPYKQNPYHNKNNDDKKKRKRIEPKKPNTPNPAPQGGQAGSNPGSNNQNPQNRNPNYKGNNDNRNNQQRGGNNRQQDAPKAEVTDKEIQEQIKNTLARLSGNSSKGVNRAKYRKDKRSAAAEANEERLLQEQEDASVLKVTEFISANDLASMMDVGVTQIISACMSLGMFVSINQRLDAETISIIAEEFGFKAQFISAEEEISVEEEEEENPESLETRAPIVTIMGHVDHGKTSLLDYIRKTNVTAKEAGGITQHIGAYDVKTESGKRITFLDTPGHEAFTAMRARGAKVTDIVIIVVAADDGVMPQTKEAINHALNAGVPIVIAINKIDKPAANLDKIKEQLATLNILVEDWGGKYQCEGVSAKSGKGIPELLEKVLLEAELLDLKANPDKKAVGTVIEAELDKGRGYVTTVLVQSGNLKQGDIILAGQHFGRVKAMYNHLGARIKEAGPSIPVQLLGLPGAPQAGDKFNVMDTEAEAREIANKREQIIREQSMRTKKHITLDEIGRRLAIGNFKQLNVIIKGDFDGSVEAITDSLLKLSTTEIQVSIIHKGVGQISESDVLLASAADAVIVGFQVRPSQGARKLAEQEEIEIRLYSIIYDAINDIKDAMEGMLSPTIEEHILGTAEIRETFKIPKVGVIAGCMVTDGFMKRNNELRVVRDGIVVYTGKYGSLKRFKDDVAEVKQGFDCGISVAGYADIQVGDILESFEKREVKRKL